MRDKQLLRSVVLLRAGTPHGSSTRIQVGGVTVSTTLVPPSYYEVATNAKPPHLYRTIADAPWAIVPLSQRAGTVGAVTGSRRRDLTDGELRALGRHVRARRLRTLHAGRPDPRSPIA